MIWQHAAVDQIEKTMRFRIRGTSGEEKMDISDVREFRHGGRFCYTCDFQTELLSIDHSLSVAARHKSIYSLL